MAEPKKRIIIVHETVLASWLKDLWSTGVLAFLFYANVAWLQSAIPEWVIVAIFALFIFSKPVNGLLGNAKKIHHTDAESAHAAIDDFWGTNDGR